MAEKGVEEQVLAMERLQNSGHQQREKDSPVSFKDGKFPSI